MRAVMHIVPTWDANARQRGRNAALWSLCGRRIPRGRGIATAAPVCSICAQRAGWSTERRRRHDQDARTARRTSRRDGR